MQGSTSWWEGVGWLGGVGVRVQLLRGVARAWFSRTTMMHHAECWRIIGICMNIGSPGKCASSLATVKGRLTLKPFAASATNTHVVAKMFATILFHANGVTTAYPWTGRNTTNWAQMSYVAGATPASNSYQNSSVSLCATSIAVDTFTTSYACNWLDQSPLYTTIPAMSAATMHACIVQKQAQKNAHLPYAVLSVVGDDYLAVAFASYFM